MKNNNHMRLCGDPHQCAKLFRALVCLLAAGLMITFSAEAKPTLKARANCVAEVSLTSGKTYQNPFMEVSLDAIVTAPDGQQFKVPAFWAGGREWKFRYASGQPGIYSYRTACSDTENSKLHGVEGKIEIVPYNGGSPLYRHGPIRVANDHRHFEHADGTPFFWLGDTWWKGLSSRIPFDGFQKLTADRKAKGFTAVQIVAGPLPDEPPFDSRWANEGGLPYENDYTKINPAFFDYADRRISHLIESGIVPAIVGGWGWHMPSVGVEKMDRHWRYLVARFGAYPVVWVVGGEVGGKEWTSVARSLRDLDPYHRMSTAHPYNSARNSMTDDTVIDFDMLQTGHGGGWGAPIGDYAGVAINTVSKVTSHYSKLPTMPVVVGEVTYEGHMMSNGSEIQRFMFWSSMLNGAAGHTYGAGGIWQMNSGTERGAEYEFTPWFEAMHLPGSTQLGLGKKLLEEFAWSRFAPHPEWIDPRSTTLLAPHESWYDDNKQFTAEGGKWDLPYAAGIPGEVRFIYIPGHYYNWSAPTVKNLERDLPYHAFLFNPASGKRYRLGTVINAGPAAKPFEGHTQPLLCKDRFDSEDASAWKDYGTATQRKDGRLVGGKGMVTILEGIHDTNLMASVDARSDAEAGIILRFHDADHYLVALYSPSLKSMFIHDRKNGQWGDMLGKVEIPEIGPRIHLTVAASGNHAAFVLTDGQKTYQTPVVDISNTAAGKTGLWLYQIGDRQEFQEFEVSRTEFNPVMRELPGSPLKARAEWAAELPLVMHENPGVQPAVKLPEITFLPGADFKLPRLPSPQDWLLVLERAR